MKNVSLKMMTSSILIFLAILVMVFFTNIPEATAKCWSMLKTEDESGPVNEGPFVMKGKLILEVGKYYSLYGILAVPEDDPVILGGTGVIVDNKIIITVTMSQDHTKRIGGGEWRDSGIMQMRLNSTTLNGTWWVTRLDFDTSQRTFDPGYAAGTMTVITCP